MMIRVMAVSAFVVAAVGCSKTESPPPPATTASATPSASTASAATASATPAATTLAVGDPAPAVDLPLQDGTHVKVSDFKGKNVVVYFYPKDQTPGCTVEAENFRDKFDDLKKADIVVIGVSAQDAASHKAFIEKEKLPFNLAIDTDDSIAKAFGVPTKNGFHARQTVLFGKDGKVKKIWRDVTPKDHASEVLAAAQS